MWSDTPAASTKTPKYRCPRCAATGLMPCEVCNGRGEVIAGRDLRGYPTYNQCHACYARKTMRCRSCAGAGHVG